MFRFGARNNCRLVGFELGHAGSLFGAEPRPQYSVRNFHLDSTVAAESEPCELAGFRGETTRW